MAIYRLPPSPFVGGRQPLATKDFNPAVGEIPPVVDDPPPRRLGVLAAVFIAWQVETPVIQIQKFTPQIEEAEEAFVPYTRPLIALQSWNVDTLYIQRQVFTPQEEQIHVPNPRDYLSTFISWTWYWVQQPFLGDLRTWGRAYYLVRPKLIQPEEPEVEEFVPRTSVLPIILANWNETLWLIQTPSHLPTESFTEEFVPYPKPQLLITLEQLPLPTLNVKIASLIPFVAPPVNDPPFGQRTWLNTVLTTWIPPTFDFIYPSFVPEEPAVVNDPPFGRRVLWLNTVMDAWIPPPPLPTMPIHQFTPPPSGDIIIWMWKRVL